MEDDQNESFVALRNWLANVSKRYHFTVQELQYIFCEDDYLLEINKTHLQHDYFTDIITFPYREDEIIHADIFISLDRVKDNALQLGNDQHQELLRVIVHGLLHLCGLKDKSEEESAQMRLAEDLAISEFSGDWKLI